MTPEEMWERAARVWKLESREIERLTRTVDRAAFLSPADAPHGALGAVQSGDVAVLVSKGGGTAELVSLLPPLKAKGAFLVAVTERNDSALARAADLTMRVKVEQKVNDLDMLATASTLAVIAVFDAVAICLVGLAGYTRERFSVIHPGGAVGERAGRP